MDDLEPQKKQLEQELLNARRKLGMSYNTLGQIKRFDSDLSAATGAYSEALEIFRNVNDYLWQAKALHSRGEAHRRIAEVLFEQERTRAGVEYEELAHNDFQKCIEICSQYSFDIELATAFRRMGRLLHDQALRAPDADINQRLDLLEQARGYFEQGFIAARHGESVWEELENLTEVAFLVDDRLETQRASSGKDYLSIEQIQDGEKDIQRLNEVLESHRNDPFIIYEFQVFAHLLEMEKGAFQFVQRKYKEALEYYLKGYVGLASLPGYGVARYRQHLGHLFKRMQEFNNTDEERIWCNAFIDTWQKTRVEGSGQTLAQLRPELVERMQLYMDMLIFRE